MGNCAFQIIDRGEKVLDEILVPILMGLFPVFEGALPEVVEIRRHADVLLFLLFELGAERGDDLSRFRDIVGRDAADALRGAGGISLRLDFDVDLDAALHRVGPAGFHRLGRLPERGFEFVARRQRALGLFGCARGVVLIRSAHALSFSVTTPER